MKYRDVQALQAPPERELMETISIVMTKAQARAWIAQLGLEPAQLQVMKIHHLGDILVFSDWQDGRVEVTIERVPRKRHARS